MFAGYGTASFALKRIFDDEAECVGFSEVDKYAVQCFQQNHKTITSIDNIYQLCKIPINYGDCRNINPQELPDFDLLTGGFPCQAFSVAGKMQGELDSRGTLFNEIIRIAEVKKPKYMLLENVKGLTSKKFEGTFKKILSELDRIGYNVYYKVLNTKDYGIPQSRARIWFVCFRKDIDTKTFKFPEPQELKIFIKDILEKEVDSKYYLSEKLQERFKNYLEEKVHSLFPRSGKNGRGGTGHLTKNDGTTYALDTGNNQAVVDIYEGGRKELRTHTEGISPTLKHRMGTGGNNVPMIANCLDSNMAKGITPEGFYEKGKRNIVEDCKLLRRLTPKECFRLQGFLNDEINLEGLSDTQCYKLAGNGQSVNVVIKIFKEMFKDGKN